jgi:uncharacterized protein YndB with AHSA1/START domain
MIEMNSPEIAGALPKRPTLRLSRVLDAPRRLVFAAWMKPEHLAQWWPPRGFTMAKCEMDFRPGGVFRFVFRGPDGSEHLFDAEFREVVHEERIVFVGTHEDITVHTTVTFEERGSKTALTVEQVYSAESPAMAGASEGWNQSLDHLGDYLSVTRRGVEPLPPE